MTPILPLKVVQRRVLWSHRAAWLLVGAALGFIAQPFAAPAPTVSIHPMVVKIGDYLCQAYNGVKQIDRHGASDNATYTFFCNRHAVLHDITIKPK